MGDRASMNNYYLARMRTGLSCASVDTKIVRSRYLGLMETKEMEKELEAETGNGRQHSTLA